MRKFLLFLVIALAACSSGSSKLPQGGPTGDPPSSPSPLPTCAADRSPLATNLLVGFAGGDATAEKPGFHLRYLYLAGTLAPGAECLAAGRATSEGCGTEWWGTWQWNQRPPGAYVRDFVASAKVAGLVPMITYYVLLPASGVAEGAPEVTQAATNPDFLRRYLDDFRFMLVQLGCDRAFVHLEPDLWGYAQQVAGSAGATTLPAPVREANPGDCGGEANTLAGLGRCMVAMVRRWAPNAKVGLHASAWATGFHFGNTDPSVDVAAKGRETAAFLESAGGAAADFVVVDIADRDAGWRASRGENTWLNTSAGLPSYGQAFAWARALADQAGKPLLWWQLPVGNMSLPDVPTRWKDDKVAYFFDHPELVAGSGAIGMAFGAGEAAQTTPETDGGYLWSRAAALHDAGGQPLR